MGRDEEVCKQKEKGGRGIQSRRPSTTKYEGLEMADERKKLTEYFVGPYKIKGIVSSNVIELELPKYIKIYPVVNISRIQLYKLQIEGQKKIPPKPVIIEGEEEFKMEKILNKRMVRKKEKFLVR